MLLSPFFPYSAHCLRISGPFPPPVSGDTPPRCLRAEGHLHWLTSVKQEKKENGAAVNMTRMAFETVETAP
jgi:hypothetical protein